MEMRPLTREEQLTWLISFLEKQIFAYQCELEKVKEELGRVEKLKNIKKEKLWEALCSGCKYLYFDEEENETIVVIENVETIKLEMESTNE